MLTGSRAIGQILNVLAGLLVVRALTQADYGTYRQIILLYTTIYLLGEAGFAQSLYRFIPRDRERARVFIGQALMAAVVMAVFWTLALVGLAGSISAYFGNASLAGYMWLLAAYLGLSLLAKVPEAGLVTLERIPSASLNIAAFEALKFTLVVAVLKFNGAISWLLWAMVLATAARLIHLLVLLRGQVEVRVTPEFRGQWLYSATLWLPAILNISATYAHQYIVGHYFSTSDFAIYAVACFQVPFMGVLASSVNDVFLVRAARYVKEERHREIYQVWLAACRKSLLVYLPVTIGLAVLARPLIATLFGAQYVSAAPLFIILLWIIPFNALLQDGMFRAYHRMRIYSFFYGLRVVLAIGLGLAGVRLYGMWGAAVSTVVATAILNGTQLIKVAELLRVSYAMVLPWRDIGRILLAAAAAMLPAMLCGELIEPAWLALGIGIAVYAILFVLLALKTRAISTAELRDVVGFVSSRLSRAPSTAAVILAAISSLTLVALLLVIIRF